MTFLVFFVAPTCLTCRLKSGRKYPDAEKLPTATVPSSADKSAQGSGKKRC